ncbi:MAG: AAA domain-containing protein [Myxococcota bacterium]|nr:AAA domain-containing protein [Myxococcota bacterium]
MVEPTTNAPAEQISSVLRYWLNAVRMEDALTTRPKAIRDDRQSGKLSVYEPVGHHSYFKLPGTPETMDFILGVADRLELPVEGDRQSFCGHWLKREYRKTRQRWPTADDGHQALLVGWPTIYFPRSDELATVFKFHTRVEWYDGSGKRFFPPDGQTRRRRGLSAPTTVVIHRSGEDDDRLLPFCLDDRLLLNQLGVSDEELADLYETLRSQGTVSPVAMIEALCTCLETDVDEPESMPLPSTDQTQDHLVLKRLASAIQGRLIRGARAPRLSTVGLGFEGHVIQTTHHLQRDLSLTLQRLKAVRQVDAHWPLTAYVRGTSVTAGWAPMRGQYYETPLTDDQRLVAERFLGSALTGAQGPPGTGKTRLIIDLVASVLVERVHVLATEGHMGEALLLVASSNNRAVDHVFEPLVSNPVPLGLRAGSQRVTELRTSDDLRRCLAWLDAWPADDDAHSILELAIDEFATLYDALETLERQRHDACTQHATHEDLNARIIELEQRCASMAPIPTMAQFNVKQFKTAIGTYARHLDAFYRRLVEHDEVGIRRTYRRLETVDEEHWRRVAEHFSLPSMAPRFGPQTTLNLDDFETVLEQVVADIAHVESMRDCLDDYVEWQRLNRQLDALREAYRQSATSGAAPSGRHTPPDNTNLARCHHRLFRQALAVRDAWLRVHRLPCKDALEACLELAENRRSIRRLMEQDVQQGRWLRQIFPALGSTLLSLGNVLPARQDVAKWVVIDEGGQCHVAHAVSALVRAQHTLIIGDVHQLEPVIQLSVDDELRVRKAARVTWRDEEILPYVVRSDIRHSAQVLADRATKNRPTLRTHFRCQPEIIGVCDRLCGYGLVVKTPAPSATIAPHLLPQAVTLRPMMGRQQRRRGSWENPAERAVVIELLQALHQAGVRWTDIAVITPYVGQLTGLLEDLARVRIPWSSQEAQEAGLDRRQEGLAVGTVHRFQGGERSVVIFSTVITQEASLGFINDRVNLLNVAVSRARNHLVVVGHLGILKRGRYSRILCTDADKDE